MFKNLLQKLMQPTSAAGYSALVYSIPALLANPADLQAWGATLAALGAILRDEAKPIGQQPTNRRAGDAPAHG